MMSPAMTGTKTHPEPRRVVCRFTGKVITKYPAPVEWIIPDGDYCDDRCEGHTRKAHPLQKVPISCRIFRKDNSREWDTYSRTYLRCSACVAWTKQFDGEVG